MTRTLKYQRPAFLPESIAQGAYGRWLHRKAVAHARRDRKRGNSSATIEKYKLAIHAAVADCDGVDEYTGQTLDWHLISCYDNVESNGMKRHYKSQFALLPTVDHASDGLGEADFKICGWRTNSAKSDISCLEFVELRRLIINRFDDKQQRPPGNAQ
jgi:hypothetical protein